MKSMRSVKIILPLLMAFSLCLTSCKSKKAEEEPCSLRFSWWGKEARNEYTLKGLEKFMEANPSIEVIPEYESWEEHEAAFGERLGSGQCADVMQINFDWLYKYSPDGNAFYDLNKLSEYIELYNYTLDDLAYGCIEGKLNAIPIAFNTDIPVYDMKVLEENNLTIPSTWDQLFEVAHALKKKDMYVFTLSRRHLFFLSMAWFEQSYSKRMFTNDGKLNISEEEIVLIYDFVKRLVDENVIYALEEGFHLSAVGEKKVAGAVMWCNETSNFLEEVNSLGGNPVLGNFITIPGASESGWYLKPASMYAIKKDCKNPEAAAKLVNYLLNDQEFALLQGNEKGVPISNKSLTALMEAGKLESMQYKALMKIRFNSDSINKMLPFMEDNAVILSFSDNAYAYVKGRKTKEAATRDFYQALK